MTEKDQDPFARLSQLAPPEPDPEKIAAAVAMSSRAFSEQLGQQSSRKTDKKNWFSTWFSSAGWIVPASAIGFAAVAAIAVVPLVGQFGGLGQPSETMPARAPEQVADAVDAPPPLPAPPAPADAPAEQGTRMGAMPGPQQQLPLDMREDAEFERLEFGDLELGLRTTPDQAAMYVIEGNIEHQFDLRMKEPSDTVTITDAFVYDAGGEEPRILIVRSGYSGGAQQWEAFVEGAQGYGLSGALTLLIGDAGDRDEVVARLEAET